MPNSPSTGPTARSIAFLSPKGGTGKTLLLLHTACVISECGGKVLIIDADVGTLGSSGFINAAHLEHTTTRNPENALIDAFHRSQEGDFQIEPVSARLADSYDVDLIVPYCDDARAAFTLDQTTAPLFLNFIKTVLKRLGNDYDYILIDNRGGYDEFTATIVSAATEAVVVTESESLANLQLGAILNTLSRNITQSGRDRFPIHFIVNKIEDAENEKALKRSIKNEFPQSSKHTLILSTVSVIPFCKDTRFLYARRAVPWVTLPDARYSIAAMRALSQFLDPKNNWTANQSPRLRDNNIAIFERLLKSANRFSTRSVLHSVFDWWHLAYATLLVVVGVLAWKFSPALSQPPGPWAWVTFYLLALALIAAPALVSAIALAYAFWKHDLTGNRWRRVRGRVIAALVPIVTALALVRVFLNPVILTPDLRNELHDLREQSEAYAREQRQWKEKSDAAAAKAAELSAKLTTRDEQLIERDSQLDAARLKQEACVSRRQELEDANQASNTHILLLYQEKGRIETDLANTASDNQKLQDSIKVYEKLDQARFDEWNRQRDNLERLLDADATPVDETLTAARRYIGTLTGRAMADNQYAKRYSQLKRRLAELGRPAKESALERAGLVHQMRELGIAAFHHGDLSWATRLLTDSYSYEAPLQVPIDPKDQAYVYLAACAAIYDDKHLPGDIRSVIKRMKKEPPSRTALTATADRADLDAAAAILHDDQSKTRFVNMTRR